MAEMAEVDDGRRIGRNHPEPLPLFQGFERLSGLQHRERAIQAGRV